jgi:NAD(P)-dependent dehydrogenase (short-subunit alcohol dehydrogenase family)
MKGGNMDINSKVALITGAGSGIGRATAISLAEAGAIVMVADLDETRGRQTVDLILEKGGIAAFQQVDVTNVEEAEELVERTVKVFDRLDILVNNAGIFCVGSVEETPFEQWRKILAVNLDAVFICSKIVIPHMRKQGGGSIINIASGAGFFGVPRQAAYCASKGAVVLLTKQMALDFAVDNIRINAICPGAVDTPLMQIKFDSEPEPAQARKKYEADLPLGRMLNPSEVACQVLYLAAHQSYFMTGHCVLI